MTRQQIADCLGKHIVKVNNAFQAAIKEHPELDIEDKTFNATLGIGKDYTLEQILIAMSYFRDGNGLTELEKAMLEDEFTMRPAPKAKAIGISGTEEFLERLKNRKKLKCCATCAYCIKSSVRNNKPTLKPYCNLWDKFLHIIKADPYKDHCRSWEYSNKEPLIFYAADSPTNIDIYGNVKNEVMGFDVSCFGKKSDGEVKLVTDVGLDVPKIDN